MSRDEQSYKELPQICEETGLSEDYINAIGFLVSTLGLPDGESKLIASIRRKPIKKYTEVYDPCVYRSVDQYNCRVAAIDRIAELINTSAEDGSLDASKFLKYAKDVYRLIHGDDDHSADTTFVSLESKLR